MEIKGIQRTQDVQNIQSILDYIKPINKRISTILEDNNEVDKYNEMAVAFLSNAKDNLDQAITELSCAISDIVGVDVGRYYREEDNQ